MNLVAANDKHLCIEVDGVTSIPATTAYQAAVSYGGITSAAFPPGDASFALGKVVREGTTVRVPFVNTHPNVNFRFVLTNRGSESARYRFEFAPPAGTNAEPLAPSEGTLEPNSILLLRAGALVRVTGSRTYTSASFVVDAPRENLSIVTIQTNRLNGSTDTVRY